jgi:hypothetical protein
MFWSKHSRNYKLARIQTPVFRSFVEATGWRRKYKDLYDANDTMRERIKKNCPQLLAQFDNWTVYVDPNIDNPLKRSRGSMRLGNSRIKAPSSTRASLTLAQA